MPDAFITAYEDARSRLIRTEGADVSTREVIRRTGLSESKRGGVFHHLNPKLHTGAKPHYVPPEVVTELAAVLRISEAQLMAAAARSAGYGAAFEPADGDAPATVVAAYFAGDAPEMQRARTLADLMQLIADEYARQQPHKTAS